MICASCGKETRDMKIFTECPECLSKSFCDVSNKLIIEAFPEMNGKPYEEPKNPYAKFLRKIAD